MWEKFDYQYMQPIFLKELIPRDPQHTSTSDESSDRLKETEEEETKDELAQFSREIKSGSPPSQVKGKFGRN